MEVAVNMSVEEFREFMDWKEARAMYEKRESSLRRDMGDKLEGLASAVCRAVKPMDDNQETFEIVEQGHMSDAWDLAQEKEKPPAPGADNTARVAMGTAETVRLSTLYQRIGRIASRKGSATCEDLHSREDHRRQGI